MPKTDSTLNDPQEQEPKLTRLDALKAIIVRSDFREAYPAFSQRTTLHHQDELHRWHVFNLAYRPVQEEPWSYKTIMLAAPVDQWRDKPDSAHVYIAYFPTIDVLVWDVVEQSQVRRD